MDFDRQLRFAIPPFVFMACLLFGAVLDPNFDVLGTLARGGATGVAGLVSLVVAGGVSIVAMGFVISSIAIVSLRLGFLIPKIKGKCPCGYEVAARASALDLIWNVLGLPESAGVDEKLYAVAAYDHCRLPREIHAWVGRRWNVFMISISCAVALVLAHCAALVPTSYKIAQNPGWVLTDLALFCIFVANGLVARYQAGRMLEFVANRRLEHLRPSTDVHAGEPPLAADGSNNERSRASANR